MTSAAPAATGVTITAAGAGGVLTGSTGGLDGLFAALVGSMPTLDAGVAAPLQAPEVVGGTEGMISVLLGVKAGDETAVDPAAALDLGGLTSVFTTQGTTTTAEVKLGDAPALTVTGDAETVVKFVQQLKDIYQKVVVEGGLTIGQLGDSKELAGALTKLGMSPDEAMGVAERIQTMLKLLEQQQDVDDATAGSLVAMMLTVMGQQVPVATDVAGPNETPETFGLQIVSAEKTAVGVGKTTAWQMRASGDVTRDLLGLNVPQEPAKTGGGEGGESGKVRTVEVAVTSEGDAIAVAVPEVKIPLHVAAGKAVATDALPSDAAQIATAVTSTGAAVKVAAEERIEAPKGETYYKLQADKNGVETLEAVKPTGEVREATLMTPQSAQTPAATLAAQAAANAAADAGFAERVAQIQAMVDKAEVGKQVVVQMQPLLAEGGGTVRINLHPKDLGQITVELRVSEGKVQGTIAASEPAVVEQLARELHSLRHGLADAGLKLGEQGINLMLSNQGDNGQNGQGRNAQDAQGHRSGGSGRGGTSGVAEVGTDGLASTIAAWVAPDRVLDVNV